MLIVDDWTASGWAALCELAKQHDLLVFEDENLPTLDHFKRSNGWSIRYSIVGKRRLGFQGQILSMDWCRLE